MFLCGRPDSKTGERRQKRVTLISRTESLLRTTSVATFHGVAVAAQVTAGTLFPSDVAGPQPYPASIVRQLAVCTYLTVGHGVFDARAVRLALVVQVGVVGSRGGVGHGCCVVACSSQAV